MAQKSNVFTEDFDTFRESITNLSHYQFVMEWRLKAADQSAVSSMEAFAKMGGEKDEYGGANGITVTDVFRPPTSPIRSPGGFRVTKGKSIVPMTREMAGRFHSYMLVAAFERFEALLKGFYAKLLFQLRGQITLPSRAGFHKNQPKMAKLEGTPQYNAAYVRQACRRNCNEAIDAFAKKLPLRTMTYRWQHGMTFEEIYGLLNFARNCIVHFEGRWPVEKVSISDVQQKFVRKWMRKSILTGEATILPSDSALDLVLDMLVSYSYGLFVLLSENSNMEIQTPYFKRQPLAS